MITSAVSQGLLYGLLGLGVFITFRVLDFPDLTVEGTFPLGAVVAVAAITQGVSPLLATLLAVLAGALAGLATGLLNTRASVPILLAGILVMTALFSLNLRILGRSNRSLLNFPTLFSQASLFGFSGDLTSLLLGLLVVTVVIVLLRYFLATTSGRAFIAAGDNPQMAESLGISPARQRVIGLMLGNALIALSGALIAQNDGYADINMGVGVIVIGLAAIIIGEVNFPGLTLGLRLVATIVGSVGYRFVLLIVLALGLNPDDLKLISAFVLALALALPNYVEKIRLKRMLAQGGNDDDDSTQA